MRYRQENKQTLSQKATAQSYIKKEDVLTSKEQEEVIVYFTQTFRQNLLFFRFLCYMHFFFALFYLALLLHGNGIIDVHLEAAVLAGAAADTTSTTHRLRRCLLNGEGSVLVNMAVCVVLFAVSGWNALRCVKLIRLQQEEEENEEEEEEEPQAVAGREVAKTPLPPHRRFQKLLRQQMGLLIVSQLCCLHYALVVASFERDLHDYVQRFLHPLEPEKREKIFLKYFFITNNFLTFVLIVWQPLFHAFICYMTKELWVTRRKLTQLSGMKYQFERE